MRAMIPSMPRWSRALWRGALALLLALGGPGAPAVAQELAALARPLNAGSAIEDLGGGAARLVLRLDRGVPWRVFTLDAPRRLVIDLGEADWTGFDGAAFDRSEAVSGVRTGRLWPGWSRMVLDLTRPVRVAKATLETGDVTGEAAVLRLDLVPEDNAAFSASAGAPPAARFALPAGARVPETPRRRQDGTRPLVVVLDPGHGGVDPGAEHGGVVEAHLMLTFALELRDVLARAGFDVLLTRTDDSFVPLEARQSIARAAGGDVFISLHADAVTEGEARGATVYTLSEEASDAASRKLAERHDRDDLLAGVDLEGQDDVVAGVLMDLARIETAPRADRLADALVEGLAQSVGGLYKRPRLKAAFSVLKAPDIPSVLLELGFLSSDADRARLTDPEWRAQAAGGIRDALSAWAVADAAEARLIRQ